MTVAFDAARQPMRPRCATIAATDCRFRFGAFGCEPHSGSIALHKLNAGRLWRLLDVAQVRGRQFPA